MTDSPDYPRTYTTSTAWQVMLLILGLFMIAPAAYGLFSYFNGDAKSAGIAVLSPFLILMGLWFCGWAVLPKIILEEDAVEVHGFRAPVRLRRDEIKGRKVAGNARGKSTSIKNSSYWLIPKDPAQRKALVTSVIGPDDLLNRWISTLPDLDAVEWAQSEAEMLGGAVGSGAVEERKAAIAAARRAARSLTLTSVGLAFVCYIMPRNMVAELMLAVVPWLALAMAAKSPHLYTLNDHRKDPRAGIGVPLIIPGLILMVAALMNFNIADWSNLQVHAAALAITLVMSVLAAKADHRLVEKKTVFIVAPLLAAYGYGALIVADALPDGSKPQTFEAHVISKQYTSGKGAHRELTIGSWGKHAGGHVAVDALTYNTVQPGGTVCVFLRNGTLDIPWYSLGPCHL